MAGFRITVLPPGIDIVTTAGSSAAREKARRLLARQATGVADRVASATGLQHVCTRVSANLRRSLGEEMRPSMHATALRANDLEPPGAVIGESFRGYRGITTGAPEGVGRDDALRTEAAP